MDYLFKTISTMLDLLFNEIIGPVFSLAGWVLEMLLLQPLLLLQIPPALQVVVIAMLTATLSMALRRLLKVEEKEAAFRDQFSRSRSAQDDLHLISDWKSREAFAKAIDNDIDQDFNGYLAQRFARHGIIYLLPIFLSLFWLENHLDAPAGLLFPLPGSPMGITGVHVQLVFLLTYCSSLFILFRRRRKQMALST